MPHQFHICPDFYATNTLFILSLKLCEISKNLIYPSIMSFKMCVTEECLGGSGPDHMVHEFKP